MNRLWGKGNVGCVWFSSLSCYLKGTRRRIWFDLNWLISFSTSPKHFCCLFRSGQKVNPNKCWTCVIFKSSSCLSLVLTFLYSSFFSIFILRNSRWWCWWVFRTDPRRFIWLWTDLFHLFLSLSLRLVFLQALSADKPLRQLDWIGFNTQCFIGFKRTSVLFGRQVPFSTDWVSTAGEINDSRWTFCIPLHENHRNKDLLSGGEIL